MIGTDDLDDLLRTAMVEHTQDVVLAPGAAARALRRARRTRRLQVAVTVAAVLAVSAAVPALVRWPGRAPAVPVSRIPSPSVATSSPSCGGRADQLPSQRPAGAVNRVGVLTPGQEELLWVGADGDLFVGYQESAGGPLHPTVSNPLALLNCDPAFLLSATDWSGPASSRKPVRTLVFGAVRGHVTRVDLRLPHGDVRAQLAPDPTGLGTLFWTITEDFDGLGRVADPNAARTFGADSYSMRLTAYDGNHQTTSCTPSDCIQSQPAPGRTAAVTP
jgi:hypothetical protein